MFTETERSDMGGASDQERAHVDPATAWMRPPVYLPRIGVGMAVLGCVGVFAGGTQQNGLFLVGFLFAIVGVAVACLAGEELPNDGQDDLTFSLGEQVNVSGEQGREGWQRWFASNLHDQGAGQAQQLREHPKPGSGEFQSPLADPVDGRGGERNA